MLQNNQYLIISQSGRALARSAKQAGIDTHVIDLFADDDTKESTLSNHLINSFSMAQDQKTLLQLVNNYLADKPELGIVIGSGFEDKLDMLMQLQQISSVLGNYYHVVKQVKNPITLRETLQKFSLPYPNYIDRDPGVSKGTFLLKEIGGCGGSHVKVYKKSMAIRGSHYLESFLEGKNYSATFIANGESCYLLGFNETWTCSGNRNFTFAGAASNASLPARLGQQVTEAVKHLATLFKLRGLCGLDFIIQKTGQYAILEINPRPTATFELYDDQGSLFKQHLAALNGHKIRKKEMPIRQGLSRALGILYAGKNIVVPPMKWLDWVTDRPNPGRLITRGMPVCTVHATGVGIENTKQQLMCRLAEQKKLLGFALDAA